MGICFATVQQFSNPESLNSFKNNSLICFIAMSMHMLLFCSNLLTKFAGCTPVVPVLVMHNQDGCLCNLLLPWGSMVPRLPQACTCALGSQANCSACAPPATFSAHPPESVHTANWWISSAHTHVQLSHHTSLTKHEFKDKMTKNYRTEEQSLKPSSSIS